MYKKYAFTKETITINTHVLHRIKALINIGSVCPGDLGGYIESEDNLSHSGKCWVFEGAYVFQNALVKDNAWIYDKARVFGNARVYDMSDVCDFAEVSENAYVYGNAHLFEHAQVSGNARVFDNGEVFANAHIYGDTIICGYTWVCGNTKLDSGIWNKIKKVGGKRYIVSTTLKKILVSDHWRNRG